LNRADPTSDEALMLRYQSGDRSAFATLVRRHQKAVYNYALRSVGTPTVAEDVTQEVFLKTVQAAADFRHSARFGTWLFSIARNLCIDHARRAKHRRHASFDAPAPDRDGATIGETVRDPSTQSLADRALDNARAVKILGEAMDQLPDELREVFLLREFGGVPFAAIAEVIGIPENTAKSRMRYALERLQRALAGYEDHARDPA
jgi:RNA polymerase sigma-70 factor (ECF subfamily)